LPERRSCAVSSRRLFAQAGSTARPRRPFCSQIVRRRTLVTQSLASLTRWK
jgi:hypothetical protein